MSVSTSSCCVSVLNQQQQANYRCQPCPDQAVAAAHPPKSKNCTVVENGRVVVKPLPEPSETTESVPSAQTSSEQSGG